MFSTSLRAALIALAATVTAVSAAPGLSLKVTGPATVDGVENLKVVTTLTNTGDETLKLLNDPNGVLDTLPTETFTITNDSGASPDFIGVRVKYSPTLAATLTDPWAATVIEPGVSVSFTHDLSSAYNFTKTGYSAYSVAPPSLFLIVDANNEILEFHADVESFATKVTSGKLVVARLQGPGVIGKRATFTGCSPAEQTALNAAASAAQTYARDALAYLRSHTASTTRYATWFGNYTTSRHSTVLDHFTKISSNNFSNFTYDCSTCTNSSAVAQVSPDDFGTVYLCPVFWRVPATGTDAQAGTLVHEASHFTHNGGTVDYIVTNGTKIYIYGQQKAKDLALSNPDQAITIADCHEYFAENNPAQP